MNTDIGLQIDLEWRVGFSTSCLHAAEAVALGQLVAEPRMAEAIAQPARELSRAIVAAGLPRDAFWRHLLGLSVSIHNNRELAELAARKAIGPSRAGQLAEPLGGLISDLEAAVERALPDLLDEVAIHARTLQQRWETVGLPLLHAVARWTDARVIVPRADIIVVHPALGGGGSAHLMYNSLHIEGVAADPEPELPEPLRLAWLLSQLNLDLPVFSEAILGTRLPLIAQLAMLPVVLQAADQSGVLDGAGALLERALRCWHVMLPAEADPLDVVRRWWETYQEARPRWDVALTALDRMLG